MIDTIFIIFFMVLVAPAAVVFTLLPLWADPFWPLPRRTLAVETRRLKRMGIRAIADIDDEHEMGKLADDDHARLREQFTAELLATLDREKRLAADYGSPQGADIDPGVKRQLLLEVVRICGK